MSVVWKRLRVSKELFDPVGLVGTFLDWSLCPAEIEDMSKPNSEAEAFAEHCTSPQALRNTLVWYLRGHLEESAELVPFAERAIRLAIQGMSSHKLDHPDGKELTVASAIEGLNLSYFVESKVVQAMMFGAKVLRLPMCVMCSATAKYNAQIWTTKEQCNLCQKHFDEFAVKVIPADGVDESAVNPSGVEPEVFTYNEVVATTEPSVAGLGLWSLASMDTLLTYRDFAAALCQRSYRYFDQTFDPSYLQILIDLLAKVFTEDADGSVVLDEYFLAGKSVREVDLFGIEGHLEGFPALVSALNTMEEAHGEEIVAVQRASLKLKKIWIMTYLQAHLSDEAKERTVSVQTLVDRGLPPQPPRFDPFEDF